jgi:hypothetical protein
METKLIGKLKKYRVAYQNTYEDILVYADKHVISTQRDFPH